MEERPLPPWSLVTACAKEGLPCAAVLAFVLEGDNTPDAAAVATAATQAVPGAAGGVGLEKGWVQPPSWRYAFAAPQRNGGF